MMADKINPILQTAHLSIGYRKSGNQYTLIDNINLTISPGSFTALLGANGVGKSTLLRTLAALQKPLGGNIYINEKNINDYSPIELAKHLAIVLTEKPAMMGLKVKELVALGRYPYTNWQHRLSAFDLEKIENAIELTHTHYIANQYLYQLSDGQLQKALIARALAQDTQLIILDEPTAHLDVANAWDVMLLLRKLVTDTSKSVLISTHQIETTLEVADDLCLAQCGSELICGLTEDLIINHQIDQLYAHDGITFDLAQGKYIKKQKLIKLPIDGDSNIAQWTNTALVKNNIYDCEPISIAKTNEKLVWKYKKSTFHNIQSLISAIKKTNS